MQIEKIFRRDLPGHDRVMNFLFPKKFEQPIELANSHPLYQIDMLRECRISFTSECGRNDFLYAGFSRCISKQSRINAVSSDNREDVWRSHRQNDYCTIWEK